jgi:SHS2 domain-containing protein
MMDNYSAGYREIPHTADWELMVWAPDMVSLMLKAAQGMYALSGTTLSSDPRSSREFEITYLDHESLLVDFLSELLFYAEDQEFGCDQFEIEFSETSCTIQAYGAPIMTQAKEIKAVTFHKMQVRETENGLRVNIVFDV